MDCAAGYIVAADRTQIQQVLLGLMLNSIDAMRGQPCRTRGFNADQGVPPPAC